jgi:hypothetical protein
MRAHGIQGAKRRGKPWRTTSRIRQRSGRRTASIATSPPPGRTGSGWPTSVLPALLGRRRVLRLRHRRVIPQDRGLAVRVAHAHRPGPRRAPDGALAAPRRRRPRACAPLGCRQPGRIQSVVATLDSEGLRWAHGRGGVRIGLGGRRCGRRGVRRWAGWSIVSGSGRRSRAGCRARMRRQRRACRPRSASGGFGRVAGCRRSLSLRRRAGTCRSLSGRRSRSCVPAALGCGRSRACLVVRRRRSPGSCGATPQRAAAGSSIGPRPRSGMPTCVRGAEARQARCEARVARLCAGPAVGGSWSGPMGLRSMVRT